MIELLEVGLLSAAARFPWFFRDSSSPKREKSRRSSRLLTGSEQSCGSETLNLVELINRENLCAVLVRLETPTTYDEKFLSR